MTGSELAIGIVGLDTSHVTAFTELLHATSHPFYVPGARVVAAYPGGSADFALSHDRVAGFTQELRERYAVKIVTELDAIASTCDAILLESVDGRVHLDQFRHLVTAGKPIFVDKPFALRSAEAREMTDLSKKHHVPVMSSSALRFSKSLTDALKSGEGDVIGCDTYGPMSIESTQSGFFWYGIHTVEMLYAVLGSGCERVSVIANDNYDEIVGVWADGRIGTIRGNRKGNSQFAALIQRDKSLQFVDVTGCDKPYYASLLENIVAFFQTGISPVPLHETLEIVRFIECANLSRTTGHAVSLSSAD